MRQLNITKAKRGNFAYRDISMNGNWIDLPDNIQTKDDIENYFMQGKDQRMHGKYDRPELRFTDAAGKPQKFYNVKFEADGTATAVTDFDKKKRLYMAPHSLWPEADRMAYLRKASIHLPEEITTLKEAINYVRENEPSLILEDYEFEAKDHGRQAAERLCREHSQEYFPGTTAHIEIDK